MNLTVHQNIIINHIKIGAVTNSAIFQVGSSGIIKSLSKTYNTGDFTGPVRQPESNELPLVILPEVNIDEP